MISLGQTWSDNINWMITITDEIYSLCFGKWDLIFDNIKLLIKLTSDHIKRLSFHHKTGFGDPEASARDPPVEKHCFT